MQFDPWLREDPLEEGVAAHCSNLAWRISKDRAARQATVHRGVKSWTQLKLLSSYALSHFQLGTVDA